MKLSCRYSISFHVFFIFYPLFKDLFIETNPCPVKAALAMMGMMAEDFRLPLVPISAASREKLRKTLKASGILK